MRPEETRPRRLPRRSGRERPEITFGWEPLPAVVCEAAPLLLREHAEVQTDPRFVYDPDWDRMLNWAAIGALDVWTMRGDDALVGYASVLFMPHLYSRQLQMAVIHTPYVTPEWRRGRLGMEMLQTLLDALKERGVDIVDMNIDCYARLNVMLDRMGFSSPEVVRRKFL